MRNFEQLEKIGKGGYGHVFKCKSKLDNEVYAVKMIPLKDDEFHRPLREVRALQMFLHESIVRFYKAWIQDGYYVDSSDDYSSIEESSSLIASYTLYIQMEFCTSTLAEKLELARKEEDGMDHHTIWRFFRQIVEGLCEIHGKGVIHRDLSRSNVFLDSSDNIKIGDFGLARFFSLSEDGSCAISGTKDVGNKLYRAPEMETEGPIISDKVDIFSLGVILLEMLQNFRTETERSIVLSDLKKGVLPENRSEDILYELLALDPTLRPSALQILNRLTTRSELDVN